MAKPSRNKRVRQPQKRAVRHSSSNGRKSLGGAFFAASTLEELAEAQGVVPMENPEKMAGGWPETENVDEFLKETYQSRG
jgi:hypothetical protein